MKMRDNFAINSLAFQEACMGRVKKQLYIVFGLIALVLGSIGVALPILPTTPFLLLALFCFSRGSVRWDNWFRSTALYKKHLDSFVRYRAMTLAKKIGLLLFADIMLAFPFIFIDKLPVRILIILVLLGKYYYFIFRIRTISPQQSRELATVVQPEDEAGESV